jgi:hypothetical protein
MTARTAGACTTCQGTGSTTAYGCPGFRAFQLLCDDCAGTGTVTAERAAVLEAAASRRQDRIARGLSLREEAARLGITPQEYSRLEHPR